MATHSSILARRIGQRRLAGYSPWGCKELDKTELLSLTHLGIVKLKEILRVCCHEEIQHESLKRRF